VNADRWKQIEDCYHAVIERPVPERAEFLAQACADDPELRLEVESLIAHEGQADELLESPAWDHVTPPSETGTIAPEVLSKGAMMAEFRIAGKLGSGGMGEVYRATDTKLQREVALKVLAPEFARNSAWMSRFQREARVLASLNHPHIAAVYGLEEAGGVRAIAMELVEGPTLAERMARGRLPIPEALAIAKQIAEAVEYAHEKGIVHRDLKPANVKLRSDGIVKVLDFGLAKAVRSDQLPAETATRTGIVMGTPAYMAPEQAAGLPVDRRADIWAFGVVLFEMLTGAPVYARKTTLETLAAVARDEPQWDDLPPETPSAVVRLLRRCLDRNAKTRLRDIGEARVAIETAFAGETPLIESVSVPGGGRRWWLGWGVAAVATVGLAPVALLHFREKPTVPPTSLIFQIPLAENATIGTLPNVAPDGLKLAFLVGTRLWVHFLESGESRDLTDAWGATAWSPDSRYIGYPVAGKFKKIEVTGGVPQTVTDLPPNYGGASWSREGVIIFSDRSAIFRVPSAGGVPVQITAVDLARQETGHIFPRFLPDGRHFFYTRRSLDERNSGIYLGSVDLRPEQQSSKPLVKSFWAVEYSPSADSGAGYLLFMREDTLLAQPFDTRRMELTGQAVPVAERISDGRGFSVSANGTLVFQRTALDLQTNWYDREGKILGTVGDSGDYRGLELSPDGTRAALSKGGFGQALNIWLLDLSRNASSRFAFDSASDTNPVWSPDGSQIVFSSNRDGQFNLYQEPANGASDAELLLKSEEDKFATSWSRDGKFLLYEASNPQTQRDIWVLPLKGDKKPVSFLATTSYEFGGRFSPDGRWVAYASDESGRPEIYVRSFAMNSGGTAVDSLEKWQISNGYGVDPHWRGDGRELYYRAERLMAVEIAPGPPFRAGNPQPLGLVFPPDMWAPWDCSADGGRFLGTTTKSSKLEPYTVVLNWQAGLKK